MAETGSSPENPQEPRDQSQHEHASGAGRPPVDASAAAVPPPPPPPGYAPPPADAGKPRGGLLSKFLGSGVLALLVISLLANAYMAVLVYRMVGVGITERVYQPGESVERIVILPLEGLIREDTYDFVRQALRQLRDDPPAAIVLRVESPGGGVGASDRALGELNRFRERMDDQGVNVPVIASFGSYATSGGYYLAMAADEIYAEPTSITGSIGVIAQAFTLQEMMDKIGVTPEIVTSTDSTRKDQLGTFRQWDDQDRAKLREILDVHHEQFVRVVRDGRAEQLDEQQVRELATGEVFTAEIAKRRELIDEVGYLAEAIDAAAAAAGIDVEPHVTRVHRPTPGLLGLFAGRATERAGERDAGAISLEDVARGIDLSEISPRRVRDWLHEASMPRLMYLPPMTE